MRIDQGFPVFYGKDGAPLKAGKVYIGEVNEDAETHLVEIFWDEEYVEPAVNPITINDGVVVRRTYPVPIFVKDEYSITVRDSNGVLQFSAINASLFTQDDILSSLTPVMDALFVKKTGDVMTGPLTVADAVGPNDIYSRSQLDRLLSFRLFATFVIDSVDKWNQFATSAPGNDYTDALVKRGTYHVSPGIIPSTCKRLRGEIGAELFFDASSSANYAITALDGNEVEVCDLVITVQIDETNVSNNIIKTAIIAPDAKLHDLFIAWSLKGNSSNLILTGASASDVADLVTTAFSESTDSVSNLTLRACNAVNGTVRGTTSIKNIALSDSALRFKALGRVGALFVANTLNVIMVYSVTDIVCNVSWIIPKYNLFSLSCNSRVKFRLIEFSGTVTNLTTLIIKAALTFKFGAIDIRIVEWASGTAFINIAYAMNLVVDSGFASFSQSTSVPAIGSGVLSAKGAIGLNGSSNQPDIECQDIVMGAMVTEVVIIAQNVDLTDKFAIRNCRHVRNCSVTIPNGTKYATDAYVSSDTSVAAADTAAGGWNN